MVFPVMVADTSFLVPLFRREDEHGQKAAETLVSMDETVLVPDTVLFETLTVLNRKCGFAIAKEAHGKLSENPQISMMNFEANEREAILNLFLSNAGKISTVDASVIYLSRKKGCKILSYDNDLNRAAAKRI